MRQVSAPRITRRLPTYSARKVASSTTAPTRERSRPPFVTQSEVALARLLLAQGRTTEATASLEHARRVLPPDSDSPLLALVSVGEAQLALATADSALARKLVEGLPASERKTRMEAKIALFAGDGEGALAIVETLDPATPRERLDAAVLRTRALHAIGSDAADAT